jgi:predicted nuclease of predicted toxin-antitoxin system
MRLFIDECLSPNFAIELACLGHDAIHPLHVGRRGQLDHTVKESCIAEDRVIVTENVGDFKALLGREPIHPGLIALPQTSRARGWALIQDAISSLETRSGDPMDAMVNLCIEFEGDKPVLRALSASNQSGERKRGEP